MKKVKKLEDEGVTQRNFQWSGLEFKIFSRDQMRFLTKILIFSENFDF